MFKYVKFTKVKTEYTVLEFRGVIESVKVNHFDVDVVSIEAENEADIDALVGDQPSEIEATYILQDEFKELIISTQQYSRIKKQTEAKYIKDVNLIASQYPQFERETWATQLEQAKAYKVSNDELDAPFLKVLADAENDTVASFADAVIVKASEYESFMAVKLAEKRAFEKSLMSVIGL